MGINPGTTIALAWIIFILVWFVSGFRVNRTEKGEGAAGVTRRFLLAIAAYVLVFRVHDPRLGVLNDRFVPDDLWVAWLGAIMTVAGIALAIWARVHIGRYWSGNVVLKENHQLIRTGPYARIRHPIYAGILLALAGSALAFGRISGLFGLAIYILMFRLKARKEEALLAGKFGPAFEEHRRHTGFFFPKLFGVPPRLPAQ